jgi:hypothetical protein
MFFGNVVRYTDTSNSAYQDYAEGEYLALGEQVWAAVFFAHNLQGLSLMEALLINAL